MKWKDEYENLASVVRDLQSELKTKDAIIERFGLAEKMREPLKTWEVTYGGKWVEEVSAHKANKCTPPNTDCYRFCMNDNTLVADFNDVQSVKLISTGE